MDVDQVIHLIDDDPAILNSVAGFLRARGFPVQTYSEPADLLEAAKPGISGCVVTDIYMPEMTGLELVAALGERSVTLPTIFMTAHADMTLRTEVSKLAAVAILEKPFKKGALIAAVRSALRIEGGEETNQVSSAAILQTRFSSLTELEKEILRLLVELRSNQSVAASLSISVRELERRRATIMSKMHAATIADLASFWSTVARSYQST
jgi:two-component system, LuxR family, response regulator FixJ